MTTPLLPALPLWRIALRCACPRCGQGKLYASYLKIAPICTRCGLDLQAEDSGDGPAVFLIFLLGFLITPFAIWSGLVYDWPAWLHALIWGSLTIATAILLLPPLKAATIALQYRHRRHGNGIL